MRRIKSPEEIEKSQKKMKFVVGGILIFLMIFSTAGFALYGGGGSSGSSQEDTGSGSDSDVNYNGQYFVYDLNGQQFYFTNIIELARSVPIEITSTLSNYAGSPVFIDSKNEEVISEISNNLGRYVTRLQEACYGACEEDLPEKGCDENLIIWREAEENRVYQENNCVFIEGDLVAVDAFLYRILGLL